MKVTIAICTYNRAKDLGEAIDSCLSQDFDKANYEVVIIDNRSTDQTVNIVNKYINSIEPKVRYFYEENLGLSYARNRAISEARGEYILFLDDDAIACKDWVREIVNIFDNNSTIGCVGGKIDPIWEGEIPVWLPERYMSLYSILDYSSDLSEMLAPSIPFGANVAFRKEIFNVINPFRVDLGRVGKNLLSSEESELISRIRQKFKIFYSPTASVKHKIAADRSTKKWFFRRIYWQGVSDAVRTERKTKFFLKQNVKIVIASIALLLSFYHVKSRIKLMVKILHGSGGVAGIFGTYKST